jgi:hypothetical protein
LRDVWQAAAVRFLTGPREAAGECSPPIPQSAGRLRLRNPVGLYSTGLSPLENRASRPRP